MYYCPIVFFASLQDPNNIDPEFASLELAHDSFYTIGQFSKYSNADRFKITIVWFDFEYQKSYKYEQEIIAPDDLVSVYFMIVTQAICCVWVVGENETISYHNFNCPEILFQYDTESELKLGQSLSEYNRRRDILSIDSNTIHLNTISLMRKYKYRFVPICEGECEIDLTGIDQTLSDGTIRRLNDVNLFDFQEASIPSKLAVKWSLNDLEFNAFFMFNVESTLRIIERFYGAHPETKSDFIIRIDAANKKYELALYRQGLKEPVVIPESAYQLIVFKNKFEDYRSENYNQPRGAWIW